MDNREDMDEFLSALLREEKKDSESAKAVNAIFSLLYDHYSAMISAGFPEERAFQVVLFLFNRILDDRKKPDGKEE